VHDVVIEDQQIARIGLLCLSWKFARRNPVQLLRLAGMPVSKTSMENDKALSETKNKGS
jgi:hypothetical protein